MKLWIVLAVAITASTPTRAAHAVRLALWLQTHGVADARGFHRSPRMQCGWGCGAQFSASQMRAQLADSRG